MVEPTVSVDWTAWAGVGAALILAFDRLARITATKKDNAIVERIHRVFSILAADFCAESTNGSSKQRIRERAPNEDGDLVSPTDTRAENCFPDNPPLIAEAAETDQADRAAAPKSRL